MEKRAIDVVLFFASWFVKTMNVNTAKIKTLKTIFKIYLTRLFRNKLTLFR